MKNPKLIVVIGLVAAYAPSTAVAVDLLPLGEIVDGEEVLYAQRLVVDADGATAFESLGTTTVFLEDETTFQIDYDTLRDPDGRRYAVEGGAYQQSEDDPVVYELFVKRYIPESFSVEEAVAEYLAMFPSASAAEVEEFRERWNRALVPQEPPRIIDPAVEEWIAGAAAADTIELALTTAEQLPLDLPEAPNVALEFEPALWLDGMEQRLLAIEDHKTGVYAIQDEILVDIEPLGAELLWRSWSVISMGIDATPAVVEWLVDDGRIARIDIPIEPTYATVNNDGEDIRIATQVKQFWDSGYKGDRGSGKSAQPDIYVGIVDGMIDQDHPAWNDFSYLNPVSRCVDVWKHYPSGWLQIPVSQNHGHPGADHGNKVATQLLADLTQYQDESVWYPPTQRALSGQSPESLFSFLETQGGNWALFADQLIALNVDIVNFSIGCDLPDCQCKLNRWEDQHINRLYKSDIFVAQIAGNEGHAEHDPYVPLPCNVRAPAAAAGAFVVGATMKDVADLNTADIMWGPDSEHGSCRGGDALDRPLIKITAPRGRQDGTAAKWDDIYGDSGCGTSEASPLVAGAVADLKDFFIARKGASWANDVGWLYANMMLMGDGQGEYAMQGETTAVDELWGVGRMRMRMFNAAGMDTPWRWGVKAVELDHGETVYHDLNSRGPLNHVVPDDADWFRAALWYYEPEISPNFDTSSIVYYLCDPQYCSSCNGRAPGAQRLWKGDDIGDETWRLKMYGMSIPMSWEYYYYYLQPTRKVYSVFYWEDRDRDDLDGPDGSVL